jgi:putative methyltransferase (TIGR04325 family)
MKTLIKKFPPVLFFRKKRFEKHFATHVNVNYFRGVYHSFKEASLSSPSTKPLGYNNKKAASMYKERLESVYPADYPVMFWLEKHRKEIKRVFDFGGHVGVHFYSYSKYVNVPMSAEWTVCDVESVVQEGKLLAEERHTTNLNFVTDINECESYDLFMANGSLQYLEWELHEKLGQLKNKPKFVIINTTPIHQNQKTITLQSIGTSFCPYYIRSEEEFFCGMKSIGYELVDVWKNDEKKCQIAFEEQRSLNYYRGAFLIYKGN